MKTSCARKGFARTAQLLLLGALSGLAMVAANAAGSSNEEFAISNADPGRAGGQLVVSLRSEPKTFNPVLAADNYSRQVIWRMMGDLVHINRLTQQTEPALAASWKASPDGRKYTLRLRRGLRFSDGHPVDADDVVFSFQVYLDEKIDSPQRDLLIVGGKPIEVRKVDAETVEFDMAQPYGAGERIFDSIAILPRHLLEAEYRAGKFSEAWSLNTPAAQIAGLGPFRLKEYVPGQRVVLEKNPYYWKEDRAGTRLPYLDQIVFLAVPSADAEVARFQAGELDEISRVSVDSFSLISREQQSRGDEAVDAGPSLEYSFLFFNQNDLSHRALPQVARKQEWFRDVRFRQAVSLAIDRQAMARLVYQNRAAPIFGPVTPGIKNWIDPALPHPTRSLRQARALLQQAGFRFSGGGDGDSAPALLDPHGQPVEFTILTSASNAERLKMATLIQADLQDLGVRAQVVPMEFRAMLDRIQQTYDYDATLLSIASGDADPTSDMNIWRSNGPQHFWNLTETVQPATPWEAEVDKLLDRQLASANVTERKQTYDRVQELIAENVPVIFLVSPHLLACAKADLGNFHVAVLEHPTLWNADELFWRKQ
jgi:peptide/nickel transport system substrate-binding protein